MPSLADYASVNSLPPKQCPRRIFPSDCLACEALGAEHTRRSHALASGWAGGRLEAPEPDLGLTVSATPIAGERPHPARRSFPHRSSAWTSSRYGRVTPTAPSCWISNGGSPWPCCPTERPRPWRSGWKPILRSR